MSSAHVYVRLHKGQTIDDISEGNKVNNIDVVYTPWSNLKKTASMDVGQVGFHNPKMVRTVRVEKRINEIVNRLNRTKVERKPDFKAEREAVSAAERAERKLQLRDKKRREEMERLEKERQAELRSYKGLMVSENMTSNKQIGATSKSLQELEEDFINHLNLGNVKPNEVPDDTVKAVAEVLAKSTSLKVSEDGKKVGRTTEIPKPEEVIEQLDSRTVAATPFQYDVTQEDLENFFGQFAKVNSVRLPRHVGDKRFFCGIALIEFSTEEDAEKALNENLVYAGTTLELKQKKDFDVQRARETEAFEMSHSLGGLSHKNNSNSEANYPKGLIIAFALKKIVNATEQDGTDDAANGENVNKDEEAPGDNVDKDNKEKNDTNNGLGSEEKETEDEERSPEGPTEMGDEKEERVTAAAYVDDMNVVLREDLKAVFKKYGTVKFIDFKIGVDSGYIRFEEPEAAQKARAAAVLAEQGGLVVKNYIATLEPVSGDAEREYWSLLRGNQEKWRENKGNRGRGGKYNRGGKFGRSRENDTARGRPNKARKVGAA
ncbi:La protein 1 [Morella rubra]|uniref:La protein 1 n=1 Tax=Morella rubra TaxID=262757 RepID=A0A6A1UXI4_9ROSI|nr:La protein 1 [Morella rubra]